MIVDFLWVGFVPMLPISIVSGDLSLFSSRCFSDYLGNCLLCIRMILTGRCLQYSLHLLSFCCLACAEEIASVYLLGTKRISAGFRHMGR
ncbi:hypothetical protein OWV82_015356 [Melia azedarach]|uniref:Uncharacterized protein n=1 Tax=Melia azedarach TaxID=155640 RepID=A0ACC1XPZ3_MELAZ|nr:hypothetical protein OWV82_015356 [Melia azedarach]